VTELVLEFRSECAYGQSIRASCCREAGGDGGGEGGEEDAAAAAAAAAGGVVDADSKMRLVHMLLKEGVEAGAYTRSLFSST